MNNMNISSFKIYSETLSARKRRTTNLLQNDLLSLNSWMAFDDFVSFDFTLDSN